MTPPAWLFDALYVLSIVILVYFTALQLVLLFLLAFPSWTCGGLARTSRDYGGRQIALRLRSGPRAAYNWKPPW